MDKYLAQAQHQLHQVDWAWVRAQTLEWRFVLTCAALYTVTVKWVNRSRPSAPSRVSKTGIFKWLCVIHNAALALYSMWTFARAFPIVAARFSRTDIPIQQRICSNRRELFDAGLENLTYLFYLSKFYEVIDTAIILLKGKASPLLQTYHHAGAMITMFAGAKYYATPIWLFVVFNSFIHSIMYVYYTCSTVRLPFPRVLKKSLTTLQITQFLVGGSWAALHLVFKPENGTSCLPDAGAKLATWLNLIYLMPLTVLFVQFFIREYSRKTPNSATANGRRNSRSVQAAQGAAQRTFKEGLRVKA
ncbi:hypothetical protein PYCC9005_000093 [Savitreella phatthalungensis]